MRVDPMLSRSEIRALPLSQQLSIGGNATDVVEWNHSDRFYDKQKVKEARLKAKLAHYKAERQMRMYYDKYGNEMSDTDVDSEESSESEEDVQL